MKSIGLKKGGKIIAQFFLTKTRFFGEAKNGILEQCGIIDSGLEV